MALKSISFHTDYTNTPHEFLTIGKVHFAFHKISTSFHMRRYTDDILKYFYVYSLAVGKFNSISYETYSTLNRVIIFMDFGKFAEIGYIDNVSLNYEKIFIFLKKDKIISHIKFSRQNHVKRCVVIVYDNLLRCFSLNYGIGELFYLPFEENISCIKVSDDFNIIVNFEKGKKIYMLEKIVGETKNYERTFERAFQLGNNSLINMIGKDVIGEIKKYLL